MAESPSSAVPALPGLAVEAVEWLPSGAGSGLVRVRGRWTEEQAREPELPVLVLAAGGREHRFDSLPDARFSRDPSSWRGTYLVPAELVASEPDVLWLQWPSGTRAGLAPLADPPAAPVATPSGDEEPDAGGQVIDRAVLAERRARRAEAAEQSQARVAAEALKAVEVLELRSAELERRLAEAVAERDALAARPPEDPDPDNALATALASLAELRTRAREWQARLRTSELSRSTDAVRLAVLEADRASTTTALRGELDAARREAAARAEEVEVARGEAAARAEKVEALASELAAARTEASNSVRDRDLARADVASRDEELAALRAEAASLAERLERAGADAAQAREAAEARIAQLEAEREQVRAELVRAREDAGAQLALASSRTGDLEAELASAQGRLRTAEATVVAAETRLRVETVARTALEDELDRERTEWQADRAATAELEEQASSARAERDAERTTVTHLRSELQSAHAAIEDLERRLAAAGAEREAATGLRRDLEAARRAADAAAAEARSERDASRAAAGEANAALASTRSAMEGLSEQAAAGRSALERLHADLEAERRARAAADAALAEARVEAEVARAAAAEASAALDSTRAELEGLTEQAAAGRAALERLQAQLAAERGLRDRIAAVEPSPPVPIAPEQLERLGAASPPSDAAGRMVADLDAAADALRRRSPAPLEPADPVASRAAHSVGAPPSGDAADRPPPADPVDQVEVAGAVEETGQPRAADEGVAQPKPSPRPITSPSRPPARAHVVGRSRRDYPLLRGALVKLAHDDPATAGRVLTALLPVHAMVVDAAVAYDVTIRGVGTFGVTVAGRRTYVERLEKPRPRRQADFHLSGDPLTLAELLAGVDHKVRRFFGPVRVRGRRRQLKSLRTLPTTTAGLADAARAGAKLDPELVYRTFAYAVHPSWTRGHRFTVEQAITGESPETWYLVVRDGAGLTATAAAPPHPPEAVVSMTRATFDRMLRGEPPPRGERPAVRGSREAVALMRAWTLRAQGIDPPAS